MTIESAVNAGITYSGNDSTTVFSFPFKVNLTSQVEVIVRDSLGVETTKVLDTDYTVTNQNIEGSGSLTYPISGDPLPTGSKITITPVMDYKQSTDIRNQGRFAPQSHEDAFDTLMMHIKELKGLVDRAVKFKKSSEITDAEFDEDPVDNSVLTWDGTTGKIKNTSAASLDVALISSFWETIMANTNLSDSLDDLGIPAFAQTLLDDTTSAAARTTLGAQAQDDDLDDIAALAVARGDILIGNSTPEWSKLAVGSDKEVIVSDGTDLSWGTVPRTLRSIQTFTSSGTWTKPAGITAVVVEVQAGGGGGAGSVSSSVGGGGGSGGYSQKFITSGLGATETVTIGAGGAGGASGGGGGSVGATGGSSSFGSHCSATGGTGATPNGSSGNGGVGSGGDLNINGNAGDAGQANSVKCGTSGAAAPRFGGCPGGQLGAGIAGDANSGAGGGGGYNNTAGGAGGSGIVAVWEYS